MQRSLAVALLALTCTVAPLRAQVTPGSRDGWMLTVGVGAGTMQAQSGEYAMHSSGKTTLVGRLGRTVRPDLVLGAEVLTQRVQASTARSTTTFTTATAQYFPAVTKGVFLKGGLGVARYGATAPTADGTAVEFRTMSLGVVAGMGLDLPLTRRLVVTPFADYYHATKTAGKLNGGRGSVLGFNVVNLGVALSAH